MSEQLTTVHCRKNTAITTATTCAGGCRSSWCWRGVGARGPRTRPGPNRPGGGHSAEEIGEGCANVSRLSATASRRREGQDTLLDTMIRSIAEVAKQKIGGRLLAQAATIDPTY